MVILARAVAALLAAACAGQAAAQVACPNNANNRVSALSTLVTGRTLCAARAPDRWQEFHQAGGALIDWKRGPGHAVDPTEQVGTWSAVNGAASVLTHTYGGTSFSWLVCQTGNSGNFTLVSTGSSGTISGVSILNGQVACP
jgi:hypothetical protein